MGCCSTRVDRAVIEAPPAMGRLFSEFTISPSGLRTLGPASFRATRKHTVYPGRSSSIAQAVVDVDPVARGARAPPPPTTPVSPPTGFAKRKAAAAALGSASRARKAHSWEKEYYPPMELFGAPTALNQ
jgi:hypothetical protein